MIGTIKKLSSGKYIVEIADSAKELCSVAVFGAGELLYSKVHWMGNKLIAYLSFKTIQNLGLKELDNVLLHHSNKRQNQLPTSLLFS